MIPQINLTSPLDFVFIALGGIAGAFVKEIVNDGGLEIPYIKDGKIMLGFIGSCIIGSFVGIVIDGSFLTAALAGYTGSSLIKNLVLSIPKKTDERIDKILTTVQENQNVINQASVFKV